MTIHTTAYKKLKLDILFDLPKILRYHWAVSIPVHEQISTVFEKLT